MPTRYTRIDLVLALRRTMDGGEMDVRFAGQRTRVPLALLQPATLADLPSHVGVVEAREAWWAAVKEAVAAEGNDAVLARVAVRVGDRAAAALAWEDAAAELAGAAEVDAVVVRDSAVPARDETIGWNLPLRILHADSAATAAVRRAIEQRLESFSPRIVERIVAVREIAPDELGTWRPDETWPTAEVVHLSALPSVDPELRLSPADPGRVGTLGWLTRFTDQAQTRLLVLECGETEMDDARRLSAALVARGGPAVLLLGGAGNAIPYLYDLLIHDRPLDYVARALQRHATVVLFAGVRREEAIRVSGPGDRLLAGVDEADRPPRGIVHEVTRAKRGPGAAASAVTYVWDRVKRISGIWSGLDFAHEWGGLIPYVETLSDVREHVTTTPLPTVRVSGAPPAEVAARPKHPKRETRGASKSPAPRRRGETASGRRGVSRSQHRGEPPAPRPSRSAATTRRSPSAAKRDERWVNPSLWDPSGDDGLREIAQAGARLTPGEVYYLGVRIGGRDVRTQVVGATPLFEEVLKLRPEDEGTWVEVAVTGIGFDVLGDPVQELWLPRDGDTELVRFAVVPRREPVSVLRFILYHRNNVVQTFRLAALTHAEQGAAALARALDVKPRDVGDAGWMARLEFSAVAEPRAIATRPPRHVSIVANDLAGETVVTVKTDRGYAVEVPGNVGDYVKKARKLLLDVAEEPSPAGARYRYGRGDPERPNEGDDASLEAALVDLAERGWDLYTQLIPADVDEELQRVLEIDGRTIRVAHVLVDKVIPWALLYDRYFTRTPDDTGDGTVPAVRACLAALPNADGTPNGVVCGEDPTCLLHPDNPAARQPGAPVADSVACPRRFWGFRHQVEIPPKAVAPAADGKGRAVPEVDAVQSGDPARLLAAFNSTLPLARRHLEQLRGFKGRTWEAEFAGGKVKTQLARSDLDLIYFYCHARGGPDDPDGDPRLEFASDSGPVPVKAAELRPRGSPPRPRWEHHPLVILNGCGTVAFSPEALSPFLPILVRDRQAAGLLGTEISVWEQLAGEFAVHFLRAFLGGKPAGQALLEARRRLLAQRNPLGLAYTLYANTDLVFTPRQPPAAAAAAAQAVTGQPAPAP